MADKRYLVLVVLQIAVIIAYWTRVEYSLNEVSEILIITQYPAFMDIHAMVFIGFGFLLTY